MGFGLQDIQELTGYIEEMFSEYMTFPTILFIVAIVVALSSIACFILAPFYIKGKAGGAKTAAQVISVIDFIVGILLIFAFLIITLLLNIASDGFFNSADGFLKVVLGFMIAPVRFGMSPLSVFGSEAGIGTPILFYALYFVTAGLLGLAAFIVSCIARGKYNAANGLIRGAAAPAGAPQYNPYQPYGQPNIQQGYPQQYGQNAQQGYPQQYGQNIPQDNAQYQPARQEAPQNIPQDNAQYQPARQEVPQNIPQDNAQYQPVSHPAQQETANTEAPVQADVAQAAPVQQASSSFCGNCGSPVTPGASFCQNCGNKIN